MENVYFDIFKEIYFGDRPEVEALLSDEQRRILLNHRASRATLIIEKHCGVGEAMKYDNMVKNERRHIKLVRAVMDEIMWDRFTEDPCFTFFPSVHDKTKDSGFMFCSLFQFRYNIGHRVGQYTKSVIDTHLASERHHPEYENQERIKIPVLDDDDILEMAIDRISRNLQFNTGVFNPEQFKKFMPAFRNFKDPGQPDVERITRYMSFVNEENISMVKRHYDEIFA